MGTVTQYNLANVQAALGGANPISMSEYYRGGAYVPTTRKTTVTEGPFYQRNFYDFANTTSVTRLYWGSSTPYELGAGITSVTLGAYTYFRGAYAERTGSITYTYHYQVSRQYQSSVAINTGVPSSGTISISQLYGAANP